MINTLLNALVEPSHYNIGKNFKAGSIEIANARSNRKKTIKNTCTFTKKSMSENKVASNEIASIQSSNNELDDTAYTLYQFINRLPLIFFLILPWQNGRWMLQRVYYRVNKFYTKQI